MNREKKLPIVLRIVCLSIPHLKLWNSFYFLTASRHNLFLSNLLFSFFRLKIVACSLYLVNLMHLAHQCTKSSSSLICLVKDIVLNYRNDPFYLCCITCMCNILNRVVKKKQKNSN